MDPIAAILGIALFCFIILYTILSLDKVHVYLKIFTVLFILLIAGLIPKMIIDQEDYCEIVQVNSTVTGNTTNYGYDRVCIQNNQRTASLFFRSWSFYMIIIAGYMLIFLLWYLLNKYMAKLPTEVRSWMKKFKRKKK